MEKLKRAVIKEELVVLLNSAAESYNIKSMGFIEALILNQFLYWAQRVKDVDKYLAEEKIRMNLGGQIPNVPLTNGWIYKKAEELDEELMLGMSAQTVRRYIEKLVSVGYLDERRNPDYSWDKTLQYRVNLVKIQTDLQSLGFALEGYPLLVVENETPNPSNDRTSNLEVRNFSLDIRTSNMEDRTSNLQLRTFNLDNRTSKSEERTVINGVAIPDITPESTSYSLDSKDRKIDRARDIVFVDNSEFIVPPTPDDIIKEWAIKWKVDIKVVSSELLSVQQQILENSLVVDDLEAYVRKCVENRLKRDTILNFMRPPK